MSSTSAAASLATRTVARTMANGWKAPRSMRSQLSSLTSSQVVPSSYSSLSSLVDRTTLSSHRWFGDKTTPPPADDNKTATAENGEAPKDRADAPPSDTATDTDASPPTPEEELATAQATIQSLKDQLLRSLAEQDNTRRIAQRDVTQARQFAIKSFAKSLLDVSDNLQRALQSASSTDGGNSEGSSDTNAADPASTLTTLTEGIQLTEKGLLKAFNSHGLVQFGKVGDTFDPHQHEALFEYPDPNGTPGTVGQVLKPGFLLNERVLRPAEVGVVKKV